MTDILSSSIANYYAPVLPWLKHPFALLILFALANALMIWRLHVMESKGFEGTVLGTLIMPYCSGFANLVFALVMSKTASNGGAVLENSLVNNTTNLTLILGLTAFFGSAASLPGEKSRQKKLAEFSRINRLNLVFTLIALFLFTGTLWALGNDGEINFYDGLILIGLFLFWQILHVIEVLKDNIRKSRTLHISLLLDLSLIGISAYGIYYSVDHLINWVSTSHSQVFSFAKIGWFSGILMVMPNAFIALYYAYKARPDIVISSQIGDAHICIPMCIGLFAVINPIQLPPSFEMGTYLILGAGMIHLFFIGILGSIPRYIGAGLISAYGYFIYAGFIR